MIIGTCPQIPTYLPRLLQALIALLIRDFTAGSHISPSEAFFLPTWSISARPRSATTQWLKYLKVRAW